MWQAYKENKFTIEDTVSHVRTLFNNNEQLMQGFGAFLPPEFQDDAQEHHDNNSNTNNYDPHYADHSAGGDVIMEVTDYGARQV